MIRAALSSRGARATAVAAAALGMVLGLGALSSSGPLEQLELNETTYSGSWWFPRGGPYILGFEASTHSSLSIDGKVVAQGVGVVKTRRVYPPGAVAVRFVAGDNARLLWHPPGRRGGRELEYVPPSSLSPMSPDAATFRAPGTSRRDGAFALALLAVVLAWAGFLGWPLVRAADRRLWAATAFVFALALCVRLFDLGGAGATWDEDVNWSAGRNYITNLVHLDFRASSWQWNFQHPPISKYIVGIGAQFADGYGPARAMAALCVAIACGVVVLIGTRLWSTYAGVSAGIVAALSPHLIAHGKVVGHEAPTVLWFSLAMWMCLRAYDGCPSPRRLALRVAGIAVVCGLALATRFAAGLVGLGCAATLLIAAPSAADRRRVVVLGLTLAPAVAVATFVLVWPRMWTSPITHLQEAWAILRTPHDVEPFLGELTNQPSLAYFPMYLVATAPLGVVCAAVAGAIAFVRRRPRAGAIALVWFAVPLVVMASPVRQDGVRYVLPVLTVMAVLAGVGIAWVAELASKRWRHLPKFAIVAVCAYLATTAALIHPYYLDYYGEHVGGARGVAAHRRFEFAWWGEGVDRAVEFVNREADEGDRVHKQCVVTSHLTWLRTDLWQTEARRIQDADWIIHYQPTWRPCAIPRDAILAFEQLAGGAPLVRVYRQEHQGR